MSKKETLVLHRELFDDEFNFVILGTREHGAVEALSHKEAIAKLNLDGWTLAGIDGNDFYLTRELPREEQTMMVRYGDTNGYVGTNLNTGEKRPFGFISFADMVTAMNRAGWKLVIEQQNKTYFTRSI